MNITYLCPQCDHSGRTAVALDATEIQCPNCQTVVTFPKGAWRDGELHRCLVCPSRDLFIRKDFPQRLGVAIVVIGFALSCVAWYNYLILWTFGILFATALIDVLLYLAMGESLTCYRCHAEYRDLPGLGGHGPFQLEVHERYRQEKARMTGAGST